MSGYIGNIPTPQATQTRDTFTATSGQTSFATSGYTPGFLDVYLNGVHLVNGTDYTASNGSDVVLTTGATTGDSLEVVAYTTFQVVDQSFSGNFSVDTNTLFVDAANNRVGIGTISPNARLHVAGGFQQITNGSSSMFMGDGVSLVSGSSAAASAVRFDGDALLFSYSATERMRIDASGRLLVGTTSGTAKAAIIGSGETIFQAAISGVAQINIGNGGGSTNYYDADTQVFRTGSGSERMRIAPSDNLLLGSTFDGFNARQYIVFSGSGSTTKGLTLLGQSGSGQIYIEFANSGGGAAGNITQSGTGIAYNTSSDYRLKENVVPLAGAADRLMQVPVCRFNFIADPDTTVDGFLAHEVQAFVPECVTGEKDQVETVDVKDEDGNVIGTEERPVYQGIDQSKLVPLLTAALQEALARIETLEADVAALKGEPA
jgi:hypothetical protein